jgi:hypothetical protein
VEGKSVVASPKVVCLRLKTQNVSMNNVKTH